MGSWWTKKLSSQFKWNFTFLALPISIWINDVFLSPFSYFSAITIPYTYLATEVFIHFQTPCSQLLKRTTFNHLWILLRGFQINFYNTETGWALKQNKTKPKTMMEVAEEEWQRGNKRKSPVIFLNLVKIKKYGIRMSLQNIKLNTKKRTNRNLRSCFWTARRCRAY